MISDKAKYVIDTNVLIEAHRTYYAFDIAPSFWEMIAQNFTDGQIISIDKVYEELKKGKDVLFDWVGDNIGKNPFYNTGTENILEIYAEILNWATTSHQFNIAAKAEFSQFEYADPWLLAFAKHNGLKIVSQEVFDANTKRKIPLPNACARFGVDCINTLAFLREIKFKM